MDVIILHYNNASYLDGEVDGSVNDILDCSTKTSL